MPYKSGYKSKRKYAKKTYKKRNYRKKVKKVATRSMKLYSRPSDDIATMLRRPRQFLKLYSDINVYKQTTSRLAPGASALYAVFGNGPIPDVSATAGNMGVSSYDYDDPPIVGNHILNGLPQYANYYSMGRVHASRLTIKLINQLGGYYDNAGNKTQLAGSSDLRVALFALPWGDYQTAKGFVAFPDNSPATISAYSWEQIKSIPGVKTCILTNPYGSRAECSLTCKGKTKKIFNKDSLRDAESANFTLTTGTQVDDWTNAYPFMGWGFYIAVYNYSFDDGTSYAAACYDIDAKMTSFVEIWDRNQIVEDLVTADGALKVKRISGAVAKPAAKVKENISPLPPKSDPIEDLKLSLKRTMKSLTI